MAMGLLVLIVIGGLGTLFGVGALGMGIYWLVKAANPDADLPFSSQTTTRIIAIVAILLGALVLCGLVAAVLGLPAVLGVRF